MTSNKDLVSHHVRKLIKQLSSKDSHDKLTLVACAVELLRRAQQIDPQNVRALVDFMARVTAVSWQSIPFSVTKKALQDGAEVAKQYGAKPEQVNDILLEALAVFSDIVDNGLTDDDASADAIFDAVVAELAEASKTPGQPAKPEAKPAAEIFNPRMLSRIFEPAKLTPSVLEQLGAEPVLFKGGFTPSREGPTLRGFAFDAGVSRWHIILESGEFIHRPKNDPAVSLGYTAIYDDQPIELLAYTDLISQQLEWCGVLGESQMAFIRANGLGKFIPPLVREFVVKENAVLLENVIDIDRESITLASSGATGAVGASVRYPVIERPPTTVIIDAAQSAIGPYVTAKLVEKQSDGSEQVLMRLDYPRHFSARGVYVFPVRNQPVSLSIVY